MSLPASLRSSTVLITGGAGFIGTNLADRLATEGSEVIIYDNLSRARIEQNLAWLCGKHGEKIQVEEADVRDKGRLAHAVSKCDCVFHLAAQVAVTSSLLNPRYDFEVNVGGTINLLEAIRAQPIPPSLIFTSTNKVYGNLEDLLLEKSSARYEPYDGTASHAVSENRGLDFHSPYGCSKGAADQYILDYARTFGIPALVFRMSCIYGPHQMGTEDQGWVAHFLIQAIHDEKITVYGDGFQVRDILFVEDLIDAFLLARANVNQLSGQAFNIGGGAANTTSLLELLDLISTLRARKVRVQFDSWRVGDQRYYVSDIQKFGRATGWVPRISVQDGVSRLYAWLLGQRDSYAGPITGGEYAIFAH